MKKAIMRIKHSFIYYFIRLIFLLIFVIVFLSLNSNRTDDNQGIIVISAGLAIIIFLSILRSLFEYLQFDSYSVKGVTGFIKRKTLSVPIANVLSCTYESKFFTNTIHIKTTTDDISFKNMARANKFVSRLTSEIGSIQRNSDTVNAIKEGFASISK